MPTLKQEGFLEAGRLAFRDLYCAFYHEYETLCQGKGLLETMKLSMSRYFEIGRMDKLLGGQTHIGAPESSGVGRALMAGVFFRREAKARAAEKERKTEVKAMTPKADFLGDPDQATEFFNSVLEYLSKRFAFAIEMLSNHQEGTGRFAHYIVYRVLVILAENPGIIKRMTSDQEKLNYVVQQIILYVPKDRIPSEFRSLKPEKGIHPGKEWSPTALLCKAPIVFKGSIFYYTGHKPHGHIQLPFQQITDEGEMSKQHYAKSAVFSLKQGA